MINSSPLFYEQQTINSKYLEIVTQQVNQIISQIRQYLHNQQEISSSSIRQFGRQLPTILDQRAEDSIFAMLNQLLQNIQFQFNETIQIKPDFIEKQIQEVERMKQMEKQKIKQQQLQVEKKNKKYYKMKNQQIRVQSRNKKDEKEAKNNSERQGIFQLKNNIDNQSKYIQNFSQQSIHNKSASFNISNQFLKKQKYPQNYRSDKKLQILTQIMKMKDQLTNQGDMFQKQIEKINNQYKQAQDERMRAEFQLERLRLQVQKKDKHLYTQQLNKLPQRPKSQHKQTCKMNYQPNSEVILDSDSIKVPIHLPQNTKLTLSRISNYGKESYMFPQSNECSNKSFKKEPITEQIFDLKAKSKKYRGVDELDKLIERRGKINNNKQMRAVNDDIQKEIQDLLKKKDNYNEFYHLNSQMIQKGRQVLSRGGLLPSQSRLNPFSKQYLKVDSNRGSNGPINSVFDADNIYD